ncbi:MAG TPA: GatB/YqeY domain-containing protein [Patescibacteria group bacterium]|nr:GatB/YqeY domain-containing protein [Patescibacteria group bacterium]
MPNQKTVEQDLVAAMKARDQLKVETLRGLKTRLMNEKINKGSDLTEAEVLALIQSEVKRRKESAEAFTAGGRPDAAEKENVEIQVLQAYLPVQASEEEIKAKIGAIIQEQGFVTADFGKAMGLLKSHFGASADGATISRLLKESLT